MAFEFSFTPRESLSEPSDGDSLSIEFIPQGIPDKHEQRGKPLEQGLFTKKQAITTPQAFSPVGPTVRTEQPEEESGFFSDMWDAGASGFDTTNTALYATSVLMGGDTLPVAESIAKHNANRNNPDYMADYNQRIEAAMKLWDDDKGWSSAWETVKAHAVNPKSTAHVIVENLANMYPSFALGTATAVAGSAIPVVGTVIGGLVGMSSGTIATETGHRVLELVNEELHAQGKSPSDVEAINSILSSEEFREKAAKQGLIKGSVIAAIDLVTFRVGGKLLSAPARNLNNNLERELLEAGVDMADSKAVQKALSSPSIQARITPHIEAYTKAMSLTNKVKRAAGAVGIETAGEGWGEFTGKYAATGEADLVGAIQEGIAGLGMSSAQAGISGAYEKSKQTIMQDAPLDLTSDDVASQQRMAKDEAILAEQAANAASDEQLERDMADAEAQQAEQAEREQELQRNIANEDALNAQDSLNNLEQEQVNESTLASEQERRDNPYSSQANPVDQAISEDSQRTQDDQVASERDAYYDNEQGATQAIQDAREEALDGSVDFEESERVAQAKALRDDPRLMEDQERENARIAFNLAERQRQRQKDYKEDPLTTEQPVVDSRAGGRPAGAKPTETELFVGAVVKDGQMVSGERVDVLEVDGDFAWVHLKDQAKDDGSPVIVQAPITSISSYERPDNPRMAQEFMTKAVNAESIGKHTKKKRKGDVIGTGQERSTFRSDEGIWAELEEAKRQFKADSSTESSGMYETVDAEPFEALEAPVTTDVATESTESLEAPRPNPDEYRKMNVKDMKAYAKQFGIKSARLKKSDLIAELDKLAPSEEVAIEMPAPSEDSVGRPTNPTMRVQAINNSLNQLKADLAESKKSGKKSDIILNTNKVKQLESLLDKEIQSNFGKLTKGQKERLLGGTMFKKTGKKAKGVSLSDLDYAIAEARKLMPSLKDADIQTRQTQDQAFGQDSVSRDGIIKGGYTKETDQMVLIADNMEDLNDVVDTIRHEAIAHRGLRMLLKPKDFADVMSRVERAAKTNTNVGKLWAAVAGKYEDRTNDVIAEEALAKMAESKVPAVREAFDRIIATLQKALQRAGLITSPITASQMRTLIADSTRNIRSRGVVTNNLGKHQAEAIPQWIKKRYDSESDQHFAHLADSQRGKPEQAMLGVLRANMGGVMGVVEHIGDLTHRMAENPDLNTNRGIEYVQDKVTKTLATLKHGYGFEKEHNENIASNAKYSKTDAVEFKKKVDEALSVYANEHAKLSVYNQPQKLARDAAVAMGKQDFAAAIEALEELNTLLKDEASWTKEASKFNKSYSHGMLARKGDADVASDSPLQFKPYKPAEKAAIAYMKKAGLPYTPATKHVIADPERAIEIAAEFEQMEHNPNDPEVKAAYQALIDETIDQYEAMMGTGITVEFIRGDDPYVNGPSDAIADMVENNHLWVFPTRDGFGSTDLDVSDNPLLVQTKYKIGGEVATANDLFRAIHDFFGHAKSGTTFRASGEENAWQSHASMFSPLARRAMTTETRGQNSWLNFGPHGEHNKTAKTNETIFADQKVGLLPRWVSEENRISAHERRQRFARNLRAGTTGFEGTIDDHGRVQLVHYSGQRFKRSDPNRWGQGLSKTVRSERNRLHEAPKRTFFGAEGATENGYRKEIPLGGNRYTVEVDGELIYNLDQDPDGLRNKQGVTQLEHDIANAGYMGYMVSDKSLGKVVAMFDALPVKADKKKSDYVSYSDKQTEKSGKSLGKKKIQEAIAELRQRTGATVNIIVVNSPADIGMESTTAQGAYHKGKDAVIIFADNITSENDIVRTLLHEVVGHHGLRHLLGEKYESLMQDIMDTKDATIAKYRNEVVKDGYSVFEVADETLAYMAEDGVKHPILVKLYGVIRRAMRFMGYKGQITAMEVQSLILQSRANLKNVAAKAEALADIHAEGVLQKRKARKDKVAQKMDEWGPLGKLPNVKQYLGMRYRTLGKIGKIDEIAASIRDAFKNTKEAEAIYRYLTTKGANPNTIADPKARAKAIEVKQMINEIGKQMVAQKMIPQASYNKYKDSYLPFVYLKHLLDDKSFSSLGKGKSPSKMGYTEHRGNIPDEVRELVLGQVFDPAYLSVRAITEPTRDMAILDWLDQIVVDSNGKLNTEWVMEDSAIMWKGKMVTPYWLKQQGERIKQQADYMPNAESAAKARAIADEMIKEANKVLLSQGYDANSVPKGWKQVPNNKRFGRMQGLRIRGEIYDDIIGSTKILTGDESTAEKVLGHGGWATKYVQIWKFLKVAANLTSQARNFVSNMVMLNMSGMNPKDILTYMIKANSQIRNKKGIGYEVAMEYGVTESTFSAHEMIRFEEDLINIEKRKDGNQMMLMLHIGMAFGKRFSNKAGDIYQYMEQLGKTTKILHEMEKNKSKPIDAALEAQKWLFDYSLVRPSVRYLRNAPIGIPFLTYYIKVIPRLWEVMRNHPHRLLPFIAIHYGLFALARAGLDMDDDEFDDLKKDLPKWVRSKTHAYPLPMRDANGKVQIVDIGYFLPWGAHIDVVTSLSKGDVGAAAQSMGLASGPVTNLLTTLQTGTDPFTNREITNKGDPFGYQMASWMMYLWDLNMPSMITRKGALGKTLESLNIYDIAGVPISNPKLPHHMKLTTTQAMIRLIGINVYAYDPRVSRAQNIKQMQRDIQDVRSRIKQRLRDTSLSSADRAQILSNYRGELERRVEALREYSQR